MVENTGFNNLKNAFLGYKTALDQNQKEVLEKRREVLMLMIHRYITEVKKLDKKNHVVLEIVELSEQLAEFIEENPKDINRMTDILREIGNIRGQYGKNLPGKKPGIFASIFKFDKNPKQIQEGEHN